MLGKKSSAEEKKLHAPPLGLAAQKPGKINTDFTEPFSMGFNMKTILCVVCLTGDDENAGDPNALEPFGEPGDLGAISNEFGT